MPTLGVSRLPRRVAATASMICLCVMQVEAGDQPKKTPAAFQMPKPGATLSQIDVPLPAGVRRQMAARAPAVIGGVEPRKLAADLKVITAVVPCDSTGITFSWCTVFGVANVGGSRSERTILRQRHLPPCPEPGAPGYDVDCSWRFQAGPHRDFAIPPLPSAKRGVDPTISTGVPQPANGLYFFPEWASSWRCGCPALYIVDPFSTTVDGDRSNNGLIED
jgi:hypothetical protein